jgi:sarcosine oxidase
LKFRLRLDYKFQEGLNFMSHPDVIVVGLGAYGSASLYQLAAQGAMVIGLDQLSPPHTLGSSHGETRITRLITGEGEVYAPIVRRSHELWGQLEKESGETLFTKTGVLFLSEATSPWLERGAAVARNAGITYELLSTSEISERYPQFRPTPDTQALFDPEGGSVFPERAVATQLTLAKRLGASVFTQDKVLEIRPLKDGVQVRTTRADYHSSQVVVTAGPWLGQLLGRSLFNLLRVYRQVLYWFPALNPVEFLANRFPVFIWGHALEKGFYGFPSFGNGVKLATSQLVHDTNPESVERSVSQEEVNNFFAQHVAGRLPGLRSEALRTTTCLYTQTPDGEFIFDHHPDSPRVLLVSACSGHGFKHSAALGEAVAQQVLKGHTSLDLRSFALERFRSLKVA